MYPNYDTSSPGSPIAENQKLPSELIEGHVQRFIMIQIEALAYGMAKPAKVKSDLQGVAYFIRCCAGVHARLAVSNEVDRLCRLTNKQLVAAAKKTFKG